MAEKDLFYKVCCDSTFKCKDGDVKINKVMLSQRTPKFDELMKEEPVNFPEFEVDTFKTFLDLLMGFEQLTREKSLLIFPIAHKFDIQDLMLKCVVNLKPISQMDKNVVHSLNIAIECNCEELMDAMVDFLLTYGLNRLFAQEEYYLLLEPKSVAVLLRFVFKNPIILKSIVNWGRKYIDKNNVDEDLRTFFSKNRILNKLPLDCLESYDSVLQLYDPDPRKNAFTDAETLIYLKKIAVPNPPKFQWVDIQKGQNVQEQFTFKLSAVVTPQTSFFVYFNSTVCDFISPKENSYEYFFECTMTMTTRNVQNAPYNTVMEYKILPAEAMGSAKSQMLVNFNGLAQYPHHNQWYSISIIYKFHRNCKILKTLADLPPLYNSADQDKLYFTCGIKF